MNRRAFLATAGFLAANTGCLGNSTQITPTATPEPPDQDHDGVRDSLDDYPEDSLRSKQIVHIEERTTLLPDDSKAHRIRTDDGTFLLEWDILVESEYGIDVLFMDRENFGRYQEGKEISYFSELSQLNINSGILEKPFGGGDYAVVLDHTNYETDYTENRLEVDYEIEVAEVP